MSVAELTGEDVAAVLGSLLGPVLDLSPAEAAALPPDARLDRDLGADSLDLVELATAVNGLFGVHEAGLEDELLRVPTLAGWTDTVLRSWPRSGRRLTFLTSGTTGAAKACGHPWGLLVQEAQALAALLPGRTRVVATVPRHHIYGFLFTVLLPRVLAAPVVDLRGRLATEVVRLARPGDLLVSFPLLWEGVAATGLALPPDVVGTSSTGPSRPEVVATLGARGLARMVEVYGSSETGGIGWRDRPDTLYALLPHWRLEADGRLRRRAPDGGELPPVTPSDRLVVAEDGGVLPAGRRDGAVQVAGVNVVPDHVAEVVRTHPLVADCAVRPMREEEGARLKAFVVPADGAGGGEGERSELRRWMRTRLTAPERPASFTFGPALPRDAQGKPADWP